MLDSTNNKITLLSAVMECRTYSLQIRGSDIHIHVCVVSIGVIDATLLLLVPKKRRYEKRTKKKRKEEKRRYEKSTKRKRTEEKGTKEKRREQIGR